MAGVTRCGVSVGPRGGGVGDARSSSAASSLDNPDENSASCLEPLPRRSARRFRAFRHRVSLRGSFEARVSGRPVPPPGPRNAARWSEAHVGRRDVEARERACARLRRESRVELGTTQTFDRALGHSVLKHQPPTTD